MANNIYIYIYGHCLKKQYLEVEKHKEMMIKEKYQTINVVQQMRGENAVDDYQRGKKGFKSIVGDVHEVPALVIS